MEDIFKYEAAIAITEQYFKVLNDVPNHLQEQVKGLTGQVISFEEI